MYKIFNTERVMRWRLIPEEKQPRAHIHTRLLNYCS